MIALLNCPVIGGSNLGFSMPGAMAIGNSGPLYSFDYLSGLLPSQMTFLRASAASYFSSTGALSSAVVNAPRFDFDPITLIAMGLHIEQQSTNYLFPSVPALTGWGLAFGCNFSDSGIAGPTGSIAVRVTQFSTTGPRAITPTITLDGSLGTTITFYVRRGTSRYLQVGTSAAISQSCANFDLDALTSTIIAGVATPLTSAQISRISNTTYKISVTFSTNANPISNNFYIGFASGLASARNETFTGANGSYFDLCLCQLEASASSSSYIPTTSAQATRAADSLSATLPAIGSIYREYQLNGSSTITKEVVSISSGILPSNFTGWFRKVSVWNRILSDAEKGALTS